MSVSESGGGPRIAGTIDGDLQPCWLCARSVSARALFCHACGAIQPPRPLDAFTRLGLERRFDIDLDQLSRQHAGLGRALEPERFASRGARQQTLARQQAEALTAAFETLRDPLRRARYLLDLAGTPADPPDAAEDDDTAALAAALEAATGAAEIDRAGAEAVARVASGIKELAAAFRAGDSALAALLLARVEALEALAARARVLRAGLSSGTS